MSVMINLEPVITNVSSNTGTIAPAFTMDDMNPAHKISTDETMKALKRKYKLEAMYWQDAYKDLVQKMQLLQKEKNDELTFLSTQLLILEAKLRKRDRSLTNLITEKDEMIAKQKQIIDTLTDHLKKANSVAIHAIIKSQQTVTSVSTDSGIVDEIVSHTSFVSEDIKGEGPTEPLIETVANTRHSSVKKSWKFLKNFKSTYVRSVSEDAAVENFDNTNEVKNIDRFPTNLIHERCDALGERKSRNAQLIRRKTISTSDLDLISRSNIYFINKNEHDCHPVINGKSIENNDCNMFDRVMSTNRSFKKTGEERFQRINRSTSKHLEKICHMFAKS